jgi:hypothetical protein
VNTDAAGADRSAADGEFEIVPTLAAFDQEVIECLRVQSTPLAPSKDAAQRATDPPPTGKKRGRPQNIPDDRKRRALKVKTDGGTNREAARALYDVPYPTPQQVKNVPTILRHFVKKNPQS